MNEALRWGGMSQHPADLHTLWGGQKCSLLQTELKGLMDHTAYLILKRLWTLRGSVSCSASCRCAESLSLASTSRGATDKRRGGGGGGERRICGFSLLPWRPCLAYLTPVSDDITCPDCPLTMRDSLQSPAWTRRLATRLRGRGVGDINDWDLLRQKRRYAAHRQPNISLISPQGEMLCFSFTVNAFRWFK